MPIEAPTGTLDIENSKLRGSQMSMTTSVGIGTENTQLYPMYVYGAEEPEIIVQEGTSASAKLTSNNAQLLIQSGVTLSDGSTGDIHFTDMGATKTHLAIKGATGRIGVGTTDPSANLHVVCQSSSPSDPATYGVYVFNPNNSSNENAAVTVRTGGSLAGDPFVSFDVLNEAGWALGMDNTDSNKFKLGGNWYSVSNDTKLTIDTSGQLGVGTATPTHKLDVAGTANASAYYVNNQYVSFHRTWDFDLTNGATYNANYFYPMVFTHPSVSSMYLEPIYIKVSGFSLTGSDPYNENTLVGYARGGGWSDHNEFYDVHVRRFQSTEFRFLELDEGLTWDDGVVLYVRGGYTYKVTSDASDVDVKSSAWSPQGDTSFAIKDVNSADVSGASSNVFEMVDFTVPSDVTDVRYTSAQTLTLRDHIRMRSRYTGARVDIGYLAGASSTIDQCVAIGVNAGNASQTAYAIAVGSFAGQTSQGDSAVAVGKTAGQTSQGGGTVAVGNLAGNNTQGNQSTAVGTETGQTSQGVQAVAVGAYAGQTSQGRNATAVGYSAGWTSQGTYAVAVGNGAGYSDQGSYAVALGVLAGQTSQGAYAVAVGREAGQTSQGDYAAALGYYAGLTAQGTNAVAVGGYAGQTSQGANATAVGYSAGYISQGIDAVAVGRNAGNVNQGTSAVAVGYAAAQTAQGNYSTAVGYYAGNNTQGIYATALGNAAGQTSQGTYATALGSLAGVTSQGAYSTAVGDAVGQTSQGTQAVAVGHATGLEYQGAYSTAVGTSAGRLTAGAYSTSMGFNAGYYYTGENSVAIGPMASHINYPSTAYGQEQTSVGSHAGYQYAKRYSVNMGVNGGRVNAGYWSVNIGTNAGYSHASNVGVANGDYAVNLGGSTGFYDCEEFSVNVGEAAGHSYARNRSVNIGASAGYSYAGSYSVNIGQTAGFGVRNAALTNAGIGSVNVGINAGYSNDGHYNTCVGDGAGFAVTTTSGADGHGVCIGRLAGYNHAHHHTTIINSVGGIVDSAGTYRCYITPIRYNTETYYLQYNGSAYDGTYGGSGEVTMSSSTPTSDDRLKFNEKFIANATDTLMKLRPQTYDKQVYLSHDFDAALRRRKYEAGLIAQEVFYDVPELRHLVEVPPTATNLQEHVTSSKDPAIDPDYSNWGDQPAKLDYVQLIPYIVQSIQEIAANREKVPLTAVSHDGLIVSADETGNHLSSTVGDPACFGVVVGDNGDVVTSGTAHVWVLNSTGNLASGDLVTTSSTVAGYAQKQGATQVTSATFAKVLRPCDFAPANVPVKRVRRTVVDTTVYVFTWKERCGDQEYETYPDENREMRQYVRYTAPEGGGKVYTQEEYDAMTADAKAKCLSEDITEYYRIMRSEMLTPTEGYVETTKQINVEARDAHGNLVYEDDTDETEPEYPVRYLDADGGVLPGAEGAVHVAARIKCKLL